MDKTVEFVIRGNKYPITFPKVGEYIRIKQLKSALAGGQYGQMSLSASMDVALDMIDVESILSVLCPEFIKEIEEQHGGFSQLPLEAAKEIRDEYEKTIYPWWKNIEKMLKDKKTLNG